MKVVVNESHIKRGVRGDKTCCPVALAIRDCLPSSDECSVHVGEKISINRVIREYGVSIDFKVYRPPNDVISWIVDFDGGCAMKPFEFELPGLLDTK